MTEEMEEEIEIEEDIEVEEELLSESDQKIKDAFEDNIDSDEDSIKMAMLQAGCKFKAVSRLYNQYMIDAGLVATKEEKTEAVTSVVEEYEIDTAEGFDKAVAYISELINGATESSAATMIRSYCKREELEVYTKPKGVRTTGFRFKFYAALRDNPSMTAEEALVFGNKYGSENDKRAFTHYQLIRKLVNAVHS